MFSCGRIKTRPTFQKWKVGFLVGICKLGYENEFFTNVV